MISVTRTECPTALKRNSKRWTSKLLDAPTPEERRKAEKKYAHPEVRSALEHMFHGKCAYCEGQILDVSYSEIEHYRPKSTFPELAFDWNNLLLACARCNSTANKGTRFPEASDGGPILNPCEDVPADHLEFVYDAEAEISSVYGTSTRGRTTKDILGLNRPDLRTNRTNLVRKLFLIAKHASTDPIAQQLIEEAKADNAEYAAFARTFWP